MAATRKPGPVALISYLPSKGPGPRSSGWASGNARQDCSLRKQPAGGGGCSRGSFPHPTRWQRLDTRKCLFSAKINKWSEMETPAIPLFPRAWAWDFPLYPHRVLSPANGVGYFTLGDWCPPVSEARNSLQLKPYLLFCGLGSTSQPHDSRFVLCSRKKVEPDLIPPTVLSA